MANPKRKTSKTKKRTRRAAWNKKFKFASVHKCSNCGETKVAHHVCGACGQYNGRMVIAAQA